MFPLDGLSRPHLVQDAEGVGRCDRLKGQGGSWVQQSGTPRTGVERRFCWDTALRRRTPKQTTRGSVKLTP